MQLAELSSGKMRFFLCISRSQQDRLAIRGREREESEPGVSEEPIQSESKNQNVHQTFGEKTLRQGTCAVSSVSS